MNKLLVTWLAALALAAPAAAQIRNVDPNAAAQADVAPLPGERGYEVGSPPAPPAASANAVAPPVTDTNGVTAPTSPVATTTAATYKKDDLIGAAEGVFGKGGGGARGHHREYPERAGRTQRLYRGT